MHIQVLTSAIVISEIGRCRGRRWKGNTTHCQDSGRGCQEQPHSASWEIPSCRMLDDVMAEYTACMLLKDCYQRQSNTLPSVMGVPSMSVPTSDLTVSWLHLLLWWVVVGGELLSLSEQELVDSFYEGLGSKYATFYRLYHLPNYPTLILWYKNIHMPHIC